MYPCRLEAESASMEPLGPMMQCATAKWPMLEDGENGGPQSGPCFYCGLAGMMVLTIAYLAENGVREVLGARTTTRTAWKQEDIIAISGVFSAYLYSW